MRVIDFYIGDIHGRSDLLERLLPFLARHAVMRGGSPRFTFLGDLVDRGPNSRQVVEAVAEAVEFFPGSGLLLGNHEEMMLDAVSTDGRSRLAEAWAMNGGLETIRSYAGSIDPARFLSLAKGPLRRHIDFLSKAPRLIVRGNLLVCHAGIRPGVPLAAQNPRDLTWIRSEFLDHVDPEATPVLHGHTVIGARPVVTENRISIDTGAHKNDRLTACIVDEDARDVSFAQTGDKSVEYVEPIRLDRGFGTLLDFPDRLFEPVHSPERARAFPGA